MCDLVPGIAERGAGTIRQQAERMTMPRVEALPPEGKRRGGCVLGCQAARASGKHLSQAASAPISSCRDVLAVEDAEGLLQGLDLLLAALDAVLKLLEFN